jgi:bromodomain-containing protein 8
MGTGETPGEQIVRRLTFERIEELKKSIKAQHALYKKLKQEAKLIAEGKLDHKLEQMWQEIQAYDKPSCTHHSECCLSFRKR